MNILKACRVSHSLKNNNQLHWWKFMFLILANEDDLVFVWNKIGLKIFLGHKTLHFHAGYGYEVFIALNSDFKTSSSILTTHKKLRICHH